jgi:hypothetical protein
VEENFGIKSTDTLSPELAIINYTFFYHKYIIYGKDFYKEPI